MPNEVDETAAEVKPEATTTEPAAETAAPAETTSTEKIAEVAAPAETAAVPTETVTAPAAPVAEVKVEEKPAEPAVDAAPVVTPAPQVSAKAPETKLVEALKPHYQQFFEQYLNMVKAGKSEIAIKALNNCIKAMLLVSSNEAFDAILALYKANAQNVLTVNNIMQSVATLPHRDRAVLEIIITIIHVIASGSKAKINLDMARGIVKNDSFINWCARHIS